MCRSHCSDGHTQSSTYYSCGLSTLPSEQPKLGVCVCHTVASEAISRSLLMLFLRAFLIQEGFFVLVTVVSDPSTPSVMGTVSGSIPLS